MKWTRQDAWIERGADASGAPVFFAFAVGLNGFRAKFQHAWPTHAAARDALKASSYKVRRGPCPLPRDPRRCEDWRPR